MKKTAAVVIAIFVFMAIGSLVSATTTETVTVYFSDGTEVSTEKRDHPSAAVHFDVYHHGETVVSATLFLSDGTSVEWEGHGKENANLSSYEEGYWHFVYTPAGIFTISDSAGYNNGNDEDEANGDDEDEANGNDEGEANGDDEVNGKELPKTGGSSPLLLLIGGLMVAGGALLKKLF